MALAAYRVAGLCSLIEAAFDLVSTYISHYVSFGDGQVDETFFHRATKIVDMKYEPVRKKEQNFIISTDICNRVQNVIAQNLAQYMILMKILPEDRKNWNASSGRIIRSITRNITTNEDHDLEESIDTFQSTTNIFNKIMVPLTRKQKNMMEKINNYKASILLHNSIFFIKSNLYVNSFLEKASSILESNFLRPLVNDGYLSAIPNDLICSKNKVTVYIKIIPSDENDSKDKLIELLVNINDVRLNYETYMTSCKNIWLNTMGVVSQDVIEVLQQEHYQNLNIDFTTVFRRNENVNEGSINGKIVNFNLQIK